MRARRRWPRVRRLGVAVVAALLAMLTLVVGTTSGRAYLWCEPMQEARTHCCCPPPTREEAAHDRVEMQCCELRHAATLASGVTQGLDLHVAPAALVAVLPVAEVFRAPVLVSTLRREAPREARAGPGRRPHAVHSVYLI
jgi:hypothetical protein